jgi:hypothetical protein
MHRWRRRAGGRCSDCSWSRTFHGPPTQPSSGPPGTYFSNVPLRTVAVFLAVKLLVQLDELLPPIKLSLLPSPIASLPDARFPFPAPPRRIRRPTRPLSTRCSGPAYALPWICRNGVSADSALEEPTAPRAIMRSEPNRAAQARPHLAAFCTGTRRRITPWTQPLPLPSNRPHLHAKRRSDPAPTRKCARNFELFEGPREMGL